MIQNGPCRNQIIRQTVKFSHSPAQDGKMHQPLRNKDMEMTIVPTNHARQGLTRKGVRHVLTFGLLGVIFAFSMMLVIFAS
jgi:hypothetical protein